MPLDTTATVQTGTYVRESDGAQLLYHSPTTWNDPVFAINQRRYYSEGSLWFWRQATLAESEALRQYLGGKHLLPGEFVEIKQEDLT